MLRPVRNISGMPAVSAWPFSCRAVTNPSWSGIWTSSRITDGRVACALAKTSVPLVTTSTLKPARCSRRDIRKCWSSSSSAMRTVCRASTGVALAAGAFEVTLARSSVKALQISPSSRLAADSSKVAPGSSRASASSAAACWATRTNCVAPARPTSRCAVCWSPTSASGSAEPAASIITDRTSNRLGKLATKRRRPSSTTSWTSAGVRAGADGVGWEDVPEAVGPGEAGEAPEGRTPPRSSIGCVISRRDCRPWRVYYGTRHREREWRNWQTRRS